MSDPAKPMLPEKRESTSVEYVPYGAQDKIKMNVAIVQNLIAVKTKSGKTCSDRDAIKFLAMCQAKRLNPFEGDAFLIGYDGRDGIPSFSLITAHQTYLKRAELHQEFDGMKSGIIVQDVNGDLKDLEGDFFSEGEKVVGGWATVFFKTRKQAMHKRLRLARFQKPFGVWQEDPAGMICKCAEADALRSSFPTMLGGLFMQAEVEAQPAVPSKPDFGPSKTMFSQGVPEQIVDVPAAESPQPSAPEPEPEPTTEPTPEPAKTAAYNPLKALRNLIKMSGLKEATLLDFWAATGASDGSSGSLEEVAMTPSGGELIKQSAENWGPLAAKIKEQSKKAGVE